MTAIVVLVAFLAGAAAGIAVLLRVGMASEDSRKPLVYEPQGLCCVGRSPGAGD